MFRLHNAFMIEAYFMVLYRY